MAFNRKELSRLIPRLAEHPGIRKAIVEQCGDAANTVLEALRGCARLDRKVDQEFARGGVECLRGRGPDGPDAVVGRQRARGGAGAVWISQCAGIYVVTSSDYPPAGPLESLGAALSCECFFAATLEPQLRSDVLTEDELIDIALGVVDLENDGSVWVNGVEYVADGDDLRRQAGEGDAG